MEKVQQTFAEIECDIRQLMYRDTFFHDRHRYDEMIALFAEDAVYKSPFRGELHGRSRILEVISQRPKARLARHLLTNVVVDQEDENNASSHCYLIAAANDQGHPLSAAVPSVGAPLVGEHMMKFRREGGVWKISSKETIGIFAGQTATF